MDAISDDEDLQAAIAGLSTLLAGTISLEALLTRIAEFAVQAVPGADGAGVTMLDSGRPDTIVASSELVRQIDEIQYRLIEGPCVSAAAEARIVLSGSLGAGSQWPRFGPQAGRLGVHSALSIPLLLDDIVLGAINIYAQAKNAFDDSSARYAELFAGPAAVAVHNGRVLAQTQRTAEQFQRALVSRATIDQAVGIIRSRTGGTAEDAFNSLRQVSQRDQIKLNQVAQHVVDEAVRRARSRRGSG
jgi:transcriptional regulator with GAF, ATPase, and Fis domain